MDERIFTLAEAESLLPRLRLLLTRIIEEWNHIRELNPEVQKERDKAPFDGYSKVGVEYVESVSHLVSLIHQIKDLGGLLKDADKGMCDFPYMRNGRVVYLCWQISRRRRSESSSEKCRQWWNRA